MGMHSLVCSHENWPALQRCSLTVLNPDGEVTLPGVTSSSPHKREKNVKMDCTASYYKNRAYTDCSQAMSDMFPGQNSGVELY